LQLQQPSPPRAASLQLPTTPPRIDGHHEQASTSTNTAGAARTLSPTAAMSDLANRKVFKVFNQEFVVDERYNVTKELGQGAYGIVW
jgi:hypothetical protein